VRRWVNQGFSAYMPFICRALAGTVGEEDSQIATLVFMFGSFRFCRPVVVGHEKIAT
jgi:hypothetical protein